MAGHARRRRDGGVFLAEDDEGPVGVARIEAPERGARTSSSCYVRAARAGGSGVAKALLRECVADAKARGARYRQPRRPHVERARARTVWRRLGFETQLDARWRRRSTRSSERLADRAEGEHRATTHVQSDDEVSVERAIAQFMPAARVAGGAHAPSSWIRVADPVFDRDRDAHGALRAGALGAPRRRHRRACAREGEVVRFRLYERGRMVDEYLSVPTLLRRAAEGRRARARGEPDARRAAHRRRPRRGAARRAHRGVAGRAAAGRGAVRADRAR